MTPDDAPAVPARSGFSGVSSHRGPAACVPVAGHPAYDKAVRMRGDPFQGYPPVAARSCHPASSRSVLRDAWRSSRAGVRRSSRQHKARHRSPLPSGVALSLVLDPIPPDACDSSPVAGPVPPSPLTPWRRLGGLVEDVPLVSAALLPLPIHRMVKLLLPSTAAGFTLRGICLAVGLPRPLPGHHATPAWHPVPVR